MGGGGGMAKCYPKICLTILVILTATLVLSGCRGRPARELETTDTSPDSNDGNFTIFRNAGKTCRKAFGEIDATGSGTSSWFPQLMLRDLGKLIHCIISTRISAASTRDLPDQQNSLNEFPQGTSTAPPN